MIKYILIIIGVFVFPIFANPVFSLGDVKWQFVEIDGQPFENARAFIQFDESADRIFGNAGCNRFSGSYTLDDGEFKVSRVAVTKMVCPDVGVMESEARIFKAFSEADVLEKDGETITVSNEGKIRLKLRKSTDETDPQTALSSKKWKLVKIEDEASELAEDVPFLRFDLEKKSSGGNSGCNVFGGKFEINGDSIKFSDIISTLRACEFEDRMNIERGFFDGLQKADRFRVEDKKLILFNGKSVLLEFEAMKDQ